MDSTYYMKPRQCRSRSLWFAMTVGLTPKMAYTLSETALYTGMSEYQLREAIKAGELKAVCAKGSMRGARIPVTEMDRYMDCSPRRGRSA